MTKASYAQLQKEIAALQSQAEELRKTEIAEVIAKIREAIGIYGLSSADLFGGGSTRLLLKKKARAAKKTAGSNAKTKSKAANTTAKFSDGQGGEWVGRGPRPLWLRTALASGRSLEEFAVKR